MATLTIQQAPVTGLADVVFTAADNLGDEVACQRGAALLVRNDDVSPHTVTVTTPGTVRGLAIQDPAVVVAAGDMAAIPLPRDVFGATAQITYDAVTSLTVAAVQVAL